LFYDQLGRSEHKVFALFSRGVVSVQIGNSPNDQNQGKRYETRTVVDYLGNGKHYGKPIDNIVDNVDDPACGALFG